MPSQRRDDADLYEEIDPLLGPNGGSINYSSSFVSQISNETLIVPEDLLDSTFLHKKDLTLQVYKRRWLVLLLFAVTGILQGALCTVWNVIAQSVRVTFLWDDSVFSLQQFWNYATYLVAVGPFCVLINRKGLRLTVIAGSLLIFLGAVCRCITTEPPAVTYLSHVGQILNGLAGPVVYTAAPVLSASWFPPKQRATATAIGTIAGFFGYAVSFITGPFLVDAPKTNPTDKSVMKNSTQNYTNIDAMKRQIQTLRYIECGVTAAVAITVICVFTSKPPLPPSVSAADSKVPFRTDLKALFSKSSGYVWLIAVVYCLSTSIYGVWSIFLDVNLADFVTERMAGWLGFTATLSGTILAIALGRLADYFTGKMKTICVVMLFISLASCTVFVLILKGDIPRSTAGLIVTIAVLGGAVNGPVGLYYEMAIERAYPIGETAVSGLITFLYNIFPLAFLVAQAYSQTGKLWMTWTLLGCLGICVPFLFIFKAKYERLATDRGEPNVVANDAAQKCDDSDVSNEAGHYKDFY